VTLRIGVAVLVVISIAGCGSPPPPSASVRAAAPTPANPTSTATAPLSAVAIDRSLLGVLPAEVHGIGIVASPEGEAAALADPVLAPLATGMAAAVAVDPATNDFAYAVVVALRPGVMSDATFRSWRDTYDAGACSQAGGVTGHAEAQLAGRTTYIASCGGGLHTYHVWLTARQRLVSVSSVGDRRFGEQLIKGIRE
jgi:hypothetical protein